ncbi:MAG: GDP-mannose mannosyl hydrolase [Gammaproteobacteria bacterium]|nr:GDP-mannose mannosyl hydrolase [Gammaproteobacteria bacterium]
MKAKNLLSTDHLAQAVKLTPLVSIDLVVEDPGGRILLGLRKNRPAQGYWFVPGGRVLKDEPLGEAFLRLTRVELGAAIPINRGDFLGVFEHFYPDNFLNRDFSTHYVVLGYRIKLSKQLQSLPDEQHGDYRWFSPGELRNHDRVHENTKAYFLS